MRGCTFEWPQEASRCGAHPCTCVSAGGTLPKKQASTAPKCALTPAPQPARVSPGLVLVRHGEPRLTSAGFGETRGDPVSPWPVYSEMWGTPSRLGRFIARLGGTLSRLGWFW